MVAQQNTVQAKIMLGDLEKTGNDEKNLNAIQELQKTKKMLKSLFWIDKVIKESNI